MSGGSGAGVLVHRFRTPRIRFRPGGVHSWDFGHREGQDGLWNRRYCPFGPFSRDWLDGGRSIHIRSEILMVFHGLGRPSFGRALRLRTRNRVVSSRRIQIVLDQLPAWRKPDFFMRAHLPSRPQLAAEKRDPPRGPSSFAPPTHSMSIFPPTRNHPTVSTECWNARVGFVPPATV